ncbi:histidine kinase [Rothia sp. LK2588]|uniref:sensor histidine kinase n=1 Tax=Rothia sp. LK2588 TaxID=3114369 RepID=UPI0034CD90E0
MAHIWESFVHTRFRAPHVLVRVFALAIIIPVVVSALTNMQGELRVLTVCICMAAIVSAVLLAAKLWLAVWCFWIVLALGSLPYFDDLLTALDIVLFYGGAVVYSSSWRQNIVNLLLLLAFFVPRVWTASPVDIAYSLIFGLGATYLVPLALRLLVERHSVQRSDFQARIDEGERRLDEGRKELARELHDVVARELTIIALHSSMARTSTDQQLRDNTFDLIGEQSRNSLNNLRRLVKVLRTSSNPSKAPVLLGSTVDLPAVASRVRSDLEMAGYVVQLTTEGELGTIPDELKPTAQRALEELGINAIKHGDRSRPVELAVQADATRLRISCRNAINKDARLSGQLGMGYGLAGLRERCELLGGSLDSRLRGGAWEVHLTLPFEA